MPFEELKARHSVVWSSGPYEPIVEITHEVHDALIAALDPQAGQRWLDVATGTGAVALEAARRGATVTGVDIAPGLIDRARAKADIEGIEATFDVGDAEALPYEDGSFDVVASAIGSQFAPDHEATASELARVCASGGRLGLACWTPTSGVAQMFGVMKPFMAPMPEGAGVVFDWGREDYVRERLGDSFDLEIQELDTPLHARSAEDVWVRFVSAYGPTKALVESLDVEQSTELHHKWLELFERDRKGDEIVQSRTYLLITGTKK